MSPDRDSGTPWILWLILVFAGLIIGYFVSDMVRMHSARAEEAIEASQQYTYKEPQFELLSSERHGFWVFMREKRTGLCFVGRATQLASIPCEAMELARIQEVADGSAPR